MLSLLLALAAPPLDIPLLRSDCEHEAVRTATIAAPRGSRLDLRAGAGRLEVEGKEGLTEVRVRGRACASSADLLDDLQLESGAAGGSVRIETLSPHMDGHGWGQRYAYIDLVVEVPLGMAASIEDGSGDASVIALGDLDFADGSGALRIEDARGAVRVNDGSGELEIFRVAGGVDISDGSGSIDVRDATGTVTVRDSSGDIDVESVGGDFMVRRDSSGDISYHDVKGQVDVPRKRRGRD